MTDDFFPLPLISPRIAARRREIPRRVNLPPELLARRAEIARMLMPQAEKLSHELEQMGDEKRKSTLIKLTHKRPVRLEGTSLKKIAESIGNFSLAVPTASNLNNLAKKIEDFGVGKLKRGRPPHEELGYLEAIQQADPKDRLSQALFDEYDNLIQQDWVICEIEMLSLARGSNQQRQELQEIIASLLKTFVNKTQGHIFEQEEIKGTCRAVIKCKGKMFQHLVEDDEWQTKIAWFDARPQFETFTTILNDFNIQKLGPFSSPSESASIVCIVDSGVTVGNPFLQPVVREDLIRSFLSASPDNPYDEHGHGSGVASLASYYALNLADGAENEGKVWIASARVLDRNNSLEGSEKDDETYLRLFSQVLNEVVDTFTPFGVKIFNLSVGITNRKWNVETKRTVCRRSWIARTIDRLCREKDVLFIISTGNIAPYDVKHFINDGQDYPQYFFNEEAALLDPSQAALALTVGSIVPSTLIINPETTTVIAKKYQPSPFTRCGGGISKEIKPELVDYGGNYIIDDYGTVRPNPGTNVIMASHQVTPPIYHNLGTSFATPRIAYKVALISESLKSFGLEEITAPLLKAFTVNSALYPGEDEFTSFVETMDSIRSKSWFNVLGYGMPDHVRATQSDAYSSILYFQGKIAADTVAYFDIPVPSCLSKTGRGLKRLTVTVAYAPQVQRWGLERYLGTTLKWRMFKGNIKREEIIAAMSIESEEDDNQVSELPNEVKFKIGINQRSRGTVQHDISEWRLHPEEHSEDCYTLAVATYKKWQSNTTPDPFAVVVRIEDTTRQVPVYTETHNILTNIQIQTQVTR